MKPVEKRRRNALSRLEAQLASGVKTVKGTINTTVDLTEADKKRIQKEIETLQGRI